MSVQLLAISLWVAINLNEIKTVHVMVSLPLAPQSFSTMCTGSRCRHRTGISKGDSTCHNTAWQIRLDFVDDLVLEL